MTIWIACVLRDLLFSVCFPIPVVADNQSALATACVPETKNSRHINLREHWIRDVMEKGDLIIGFIAGTMNAANVGTKILPRAQFLKEGGWYRRGIHSHKFQDQITGTLKDLYLRSHQWLIEQGRRDETETERTSVESKSTENEDLERSEHKDDAMELQQKGDGGAQTVADIVFWGGQSALRFPALTG